MRCSKKANVLAHEVSFVRLRNRMKILASDSLSGDFCSIPNVRDWEKWKGDVCEMNNEGCNE